MRLSALILLQISKCVHYSTGLIKVTYCLHIPNYMAKRLPVLHFI